MKFTAVIDRVEGDFAVLLLGSEQVEVSFPLAFLPSPHEGAVIEFALAEQPGEEQAKRAEVEGLLAKLLAKKRSVE